MAGERASGATWGLSAALVTAAVLLLGLPLSPGLQRRFLAEHHLRPSSTASWVVIGVLPKMYGGRHEVWLSPEPLGDFLRSELGRAPFEVVHQWVNHSPARFVRLDTVRHVQAGLGRPTYVRLESSVGGESMTTRYVVRVVPGGHLQVRLEP